MLTFGPDRIPQTIFAITQLTKHGLTLIRAKRVIEEMLEEGRTYVELPAVLDVGFVRRRLAEFGIAAIHLDTAAPVDARAIRESLGLTQEQFALRFGLELDTLRNWETGRREPDTAAKSYLRVIAKEPARVQLALAGA
jgi:putative transcriptional regulator